MDKDLKVALDEMKTQLETFAADKSKSEVAEQVGEMKSKLEEIEQKASKAASQEELNQLKAEKDHLQKDVAALTKGLEIVNARVKMGGKTTQTEEKTTFEAQIAKAVEDNMDSIEKFLRDEKGPGRVKSVDFSINTKAVADFSTSNIGGTTVWGANYRNGIIMLPNQINHIRSLIPNMPAGPGTDFYFMKESGAGEGSISAVSEKKSSAATNVGTGLKTQFDQDLTESSVKYETIAGWMKLSRKSMRNVPGLMTYLNTRIPERLMTAEDAYILYGSGTSPEIKGILTAGNYTASTSTATKLSAKIVDDISLLEDSYKRTASAIWLRPAAYYAILQETASGSGEYNLPPLISFVGGQLYFGGIPVYKTTALNAGDYVVAAAGGVELQVQEAMSIQLFEQDDKNAQTNQFTLRIEETIALPVYGSDYFILGADGTVS